jgi:ribosomal protein L11 methyltransferase
MADSTYRLRALVSQTDTDRFFTWAWSEARGLVGVHEGTVLSEEARDLGFETESWVVDSAQAPEKRDWVGSLKAGSVELYFEHRGLAERAKAAMIERFPGLSVTEVEELKPRDWDAEWKASYQGVDLAPHWRILPPWKKDEAPEARKQGRHVMLLTPGAGFGTGTHETTQLCLEAIGSLASKMGSLRELRVLDFGSGSGVLAIGAALLGAQVDAVEIDPLAVDNARQNAEMNEVAGAVRFSNELREAKATYFLVVANILKPVLLQFADQLVDRLSPGHFCLVLSGLVEADVSPVRERFEACLGSRDREFKLLSRGEWRALMWHKI